ncbi:MAG: DUF971 domain-containing protein [Pseudomonadota bacterium]
MLTPTKVHLHKKSKTLEVVLEDSTYFLPAEFLRVHSPSAEVKGHGPGQEKLVFGKIDVGIMDLKATGNYGLTLVFDDGHDSGIYSWSYLKLLCKQQQSYWATYLDKLKAEGKARDPNVSVIQFSP